MVPYKQYNPDSEMRDRIKQAAIMKMIDIGEATMDDLPDLFALHVDSVLDRLFLHTDAIRLLTEHGPIIIYPRHGFSDRSVH